jgi:alpha-tubulin suppressor-like RCC1 family protein
MVMPEARAIGGTSIIAWGRNLEGETDIPPGVTNVIAIYAPGNVGVAILNNGNVFQWNGGITSDVIYAGGDATAVSLDPPMYLRTNGTIFATAGQRDPPIGLANIIGVASGNWYFWALRSDGAVLGWPYFAADPDKTLPILTNVVAISVAGDSLTGLLNDGTVMELSPVFANLGLSNITAISQGPYQLLGVKSDGTVVGYGTNVPPVGLSNVVSVSVGNFHSLALRKDGTVVAWGDNSWGESNVPAGLSNVVAVAAGWYFSAALVSDDPIFFSIQPSRQSPYRGQRAYFSALAMGQGSLSYQWRLNGIPLFGATNSNLIIDNAQPSNAGNYEVMVSNGTNSQISRAANLNIVDSSPIILQQASDQTVISRTNVTFSVLANGSWPLRFQWQFNGQNIPGATNATFVIGSVMSTNAGSYTVLVSNAFGTAVTFPAILRVVSSFLVSWGSPPPTPPEATNVVAITTGGSHSVALREDGTLVAWGDNTYQQTNVPPDLTNVVSIAAGGSQTLAVLNDGTVVGWGLSKGLVLLGTPFPGPLDIPNDLTGVVAVASGRYHSLALTRAGTVVAWGSFGDGAAPTPPTGLANVVSITAGLDHCLALKKDSTVVAWGPALNHYGQTTVPAGLSNIVAIAAAQYYSMALKQDGSVVVWGGDPIWGALTIPQGLTNAIAIVGGMGLQSLALTRQGTVVAWGFGGYGQTTVPLTLTNVVSLAGAYAYSSAIVNDGTPNVVRQPFDRMVWNGESVALDAGCSGTPPLAFQWMFNGTPVTGATDSSLLLTNVQTSSSGNYAVVVSNGFGITTSSNANLWVLDVATVLGATNLTWSNDVAAPWFWEDSVTHDGKAAMQSGAVSPPQKSVLQTLTPGPGKLTFWWRLSAANAGGALTFSANGVPKAQTAGHFWDWNQETIYLEDGPQLFEWSLNPGTTQDIAWLDQVTFVPGPTVPNLTVVPTNQMVSAGDRVTLLASAFGTPPLAIHWQFNGSDLIGATNTSFMLADAQANNAGIYTVIVSNAYGTTNWNATLNVNPIPPVFVVQPSSQRLYVNEAAALVGTAKGNEPMTYQWQFNGSNIDGATSSVLAFKNIQISNSGVYMLIASNAIGLTTTSNALLTVGTTLVASWSSDRLYTPAPTIPLDFTNGVTIAAGASHQVILRNDGTVSAWGDSFRGQLRVPIGLTNVVAIDCTDYDTLALRRDGTLAAWGWYYTVTNLPVGLSNVVAIGCGAQHCLAVKSNGRVVAWGNNTYGQTSVPADLDNVIAAAAGAYHSVALKRDGTVVAWGSNSGGETNVPPLTNVIAISAGYDYTLALKSDGTVASWGNDFYGDTEVPVGTSNVVALASKGFHNLALQSDGTLLAWGWIWSTTNLPPELMPVEAIACGGTLDFALLNDGSPLISRQLADQWVLSGTPVFMSVTAMGEMPISYGWQFNGNNIFGATNSWLYLPTAFSTNAGTYSVFVTNSVGAITTSSAQLSITSAPPSIIVEPSSQVVSNNTVVVLRVVVGGSRPLVYQWLKNLQPLAGATNSTLIYTNIQPGDSGEYYVVVTNAIGSSTSDIAQVTVLAPPAITTQPTNQTVLGGATVIFNVAVSGSLPLSYQWLLGASPIPGATTDTVTLSNVQSGQAGSYSVIVTNEVGSISSAVAQLTVYVPTSLTLNSSGAIQNGISVSMASLAGLSYTLQYKNSLNDSSWASVLPSTPGTGQAITLLDTTHPSVSARFYRVVVQ